MFAKARSYRLLLALGASILLASACRPLPSQPTARALYQDLRQVVETRERAEWLIDEDELDDATPRALQSVCQADADAERDLATWLDEQLTVEGGPAEDQYRAGVPLNNLGEALSLERTSALLERATAAQDACPFYLTPRADFAGVHQSNDRFVILAESNGVASISFRDDTVFTGAGGAGRLLPGWGFANGTIIAVGGEFGGAAGFEPLAGNDTEPIQTRVQAAVPLLLRFQNLTYNLDLEAAVTGVSTATDFDPDIGFRAAVGAGVSTLRVQRLMPYVTLTLGYQYFPWTNPATHMMQIGTRVGVDFDP